MHMQGNTGPGSTRATSCLNSRLGWPRSRKSLGVPTVAACSPLPESKQRSTFCSRGRSRTLRCRQGPGPPRRPRSRIGPYRPSLALSPCCLALGTCTSGCCPILGRTAPSPPAEQPCRHERPGSRIDPSRPRLATSCPSPGACSTSCCPTLGSTTASCRHPRPHRNLPEAGLRCLQRPSPCLQWQSPRRCPSSWQCRLWAKWHCRPRPAGLRLPRSGSRCSRQQPPWRCRSRWQCRFWARWHC
mmetsp:Transcript_18725/g.52914  ORF Transcript_18725/g.52914 Transcript_18725/m.52914 type:complete len:243 (+) Transcript_18725:70-798(+)